MNGYQRVLPIWPVVTVLTALGIVGLYFLATDQLILGLVILIGVVLYLLVGFGLEIYITESWPRLDDLEFIFWAPIFLGLLVVKLLTRRLKLKDVVDMVDEIEIM